MPRDSNGNTSPIPGTIVSAGDTILPSQHNPAMQDIYAMLTQSLSRDGQGGMNAPLNMNGLRVINVGNATLPNDAVTLSQFQSGSPVGSIVDYAGDIAPEKWMLCFGQAISRTAYPEAFSALGTKYGAGDGSTTFNLPDIRGRATVGKDNMGGSAANRMTNIMSGVDGSTLGSSGGSQTHTLIANQIPKHSFSGIPTQATVQAHGWGVLGGNLGRVDEGRMVVGSGLPEQSETLESLRAAGQGQTVSLTGSKNSSEYGGDLPHNNTQPSIIFNKIIKVLY